MPIQERHAPPVLDLSGNLARHFAKLATIGNQPDGAISRIAYSDEESEAMAYLRAQGEMFGLSGRYDAVGNLILSTPGDASRRILIGSHLDSVPYGGNYDGSAGLVAGLEAMRMLLEAGQPLQRGVDLVAWRGEEYTFNAVYKGSAAAFGLAETHILHNRYGSQTLRDAIHEQGFESSPIDDRQATFSSDYIDSIDGYFEMHIEQGVRLERDGKDLGIVTSIAGDRRFLVVMEGRFDHSGATPMGKKYRHDVNLAMAHTQVALDELAKRHRKAGAEFCQTVGIVNADPEIDKKFPDVHSNSVTKVSGLGYFTIDLMSADDDFMDAYAAEAHREIWNQAKLFGVKAVIEQTDSAPGIKSLDTGLIDLLRTAADDLGHSYVPMPSGAGHDAVMVAEARRSDGSAIPTAMLFVPCRDGISHSRHEYVHPDQVAKGAEALRNALQRLTLEG